MLDIQFFSFKLDIINLFKIIKFICGGKKYAFK